MAVNVRRQTADLRAILDRLGLGSMVGWARGQITRGKSQAEILLALQNTPQFKREFPEIEARRKARLSPLNAGQIVQYRQQVRDILNTMGVSPHVVQDKKLYQQLLISDKSPAEIERRMTRGYAEIAQSAPEVIDTFKRWFGDPTQYLATMVLDPKIGALEIEQRASAAVLGGMGERFGFAFDKARAMELARAGVRPDQIRQGLGQLEELSPTFDETITEGEDLSAEDEGADVVFGLAGGEALRRRGETRQAATAGGGGAAIGQRGVIGLGAAD